MGLTRRIGWVLILGSVVAAIDGLLHVAGSIRLFGAAGVRWPGWVVLALAPFAAFAGATLAQAGRLIESRRAARRRSRRPAPWVERLFGWWR